MLHFPVVHGGWSLWTRGTCSKTCGGGIRRLHRTCNNPTPSCRGLPCRGISVDKEACNEFCCRGKNIFINSQNIENLLQQNYLVKANFFISVFVTGFRKAFYLCTMINIQKYMNQLFKVQHLEKAKAAGLPFARILQLFNNCKATHSTMHSQLKLLPFQIVFINNTTTL